MQTLLIEKIALTFIGDAQALVSGLGRIVFKFITAPIERIAKACDVAGVYAQRQQIERSIRQRRRRNATHAWRSRRERLLDRLNPFRRLMHLT